MAIYVRHRWSNEPEAALLPALCDTGRMSVDVGSNWGQYAEALRKLSAGVIACEPIPELASFLRRMYRKDIHVRQVVLSNRDGEAELIVAEDWGFTSLQTAGPPGNRRAIPVHLETLDSFAVDPVGFIKIDVEGHEEEVIEGAWQVILRDLPTLLVEIEERHRPGALERLRDKLSSAGYAIFFLHDGFLRPVRLFRPHEHQDFANAPNPFDDGNRKAGSCYINNFVFIHESCLARKSAQLMKLGFAAIP